MRRLLFLLLALSCTITSNVVIEPDSGIEVYFCPQDSCLEKILELIDSSQEIYCAYYDLDIPELIGALEEKGAHVEIEEDNALAQFGSKYSDALMHNKFCVFDGKVVYTGSMNPTERGNYFNNNNIVILRSPSIVQNYLNEWEEITKGEFGSGSRVKNPVVYLGGTRIENYFCPEDDCKFHVIEALKTANSSIRFMTFSFTDQDIGNLLWNKEYAGLDVKGIFEAKQLSQYSVYDDLKHISKVDDNIYTMHHKVFVIDGRIVITGSYNPTKNANENNDENLLIIYDEEIARKYLEEFELLWGEDTLPRIADEVMISSLMYDAIGKDDGNEFVELTNIGEEEIDLDYYSISDNKTNSRLSGIILAGDVARIVPKFSLKNSDGTLLLKKDGRIVDYVHWEGTWGLEAGEGEVLIRTDRLISPSSWKDDKSDDAILG